MFDLSTSGTFSLSVSRVLENYVQTGPNQYRNEFSSIFAPAVTFSVALAPAFTEAPAFPVRDTLLYSLNQGGMVAFLVRSDGTLAPQLDEVASVPASSSSLFANGDTNKVYTTSEGALQAFRVQGDTLQKIGAPLLLKQHVLRLALNDGGTQLLAFSSWGVQRFAVQKDGMLREMSATDLFPSENYAWSHSGCFLYASNGEVLTWTMRPDGTATPQAKVAVGDSPRELFVSPDDRLLLCGMDVSNQEQNRNVIPWKNALALVRLNAQGAPAPEPSLWINDGRWGLQALGFDPTGRFVLAGRGGELLVFRVQAGELKLVSQLNAHLGFSAASLIFGRDGHTFYAPDSNCLRAFRLGDEGQVESLGQPLGRGVEARMLALVDVPAPTRLFGAPDSPGRARLDAQVCAPEAPVWLDIETVNGVLPDLRVAFVSNNWEVFHRPQQLSTVPVARLDAAKSLPSSAPGRRVRLDLSHIFDLSREGNYVFQIMGATGKTSELRFQINDPAHSLSFDFPGRNFGAERSQWRFDLLSPQTLSAQNEILPNPEIF